ncbi:MAG TPA: carbohydrate ABC transporter permease [Polyangiaceae bacterium]|nr:carbohydrate ABC transporter permease [Polyangiaceae bacterium]
MTARAKRSALEGTALERVLVNGALVLLALAAIGPLLWMVSVSFMSAGETSTFPPPLLPHQPTLRNYGQLFALAGMGRRIFNSALLATLATLLSLAFNVSAGYGFAKLRFRGRDRAFQVLLGALVIPGQVTMIPLFLMMKYMGLINTYAGVLVPLLASVLGISLVRQYALAIPDELLEAARMDGAGEFRTFVSVVLPGLVPVLVTLAVFTFLGSWNDFLWPLIMLSHDDLHTLPLALASLSREHVQDRELMMAGSVLTLLPPLAVFLVLQRFYMQGLLAGSVKG